MIGFTLSRQVQPSMVHSAGWTRQRVPALASTGEWHGRSACRHRIARRL